MRSKSIIPQVNWTIRSSKDRRNNLY